MIKGLVKLTFWVGIFWLIGKSFQLPWVQKKVSEGVESGITHISQTEVAQEYQQKFSSYWEIIEDMDLPIFRQQTPPTIVLLEDKYPIPTDNPPPPPELKEETIISVAPAELMETNQIIGIYMSRYDITNNASEDTIRKKVRHYRSQGINTIIHGVAGNGCTMYDSQVMQKKVGLQRCPNLFQEKWLHWLIDEAHKQGMEVHAYFEKGIKIDQNSPIFKLAQSKNWIVEGIDRTYDGIDHYILDVGNPEVANLFIDMTTEFVQKYRNIDAVQWDDYLGYHSSLPSEENRTPMLTNFVQRMITSIKQANPNVSFDICHHNPYWAKKEFAADFDAWGVDRVFIQAYNDDNFREELAYAKKYNGIAITDKQLTRLKEVINNDKVEGVLLFSLAGNPQNLAVKWREYL
ncbi:family 10 glycosylhydrolase [Geminocystis herdmanii]|uniref:family 10 glycosylhydrolase n=1 Tax=Geminocystis herdmanii TaxID=669359 RepID=UPI0003467FBF|nr:family 10 glycosylhydrolase [Geminocystis herdmanii]